MEYVVCTSDGCPQQGVVLPVNMVLPPGVVVYCGGCGNPTEPAQPPVVEPEPQEANP